MEHIEIDATIKDEIYECDHTFWDFVDMYKLELILALVIVVAVVVVIAIIVVKSFEKKHNIIRQQEERVIVLQQKRYQMIIDNSDEMLYEISMLGDACISSEKIKEKFGWEIPKRVDNLSIRKLSEILHVHPDDEDLFYSSTEGLVADKRSKEILIRLGKQDGSYIWCNVIYFPVLDDENNMASIVGKIVDVDSSVKEKLKLELQSRTDGLTGLLNKQTFEDETTKYIQDNTAVSSAFIFVDMDFFKTINDQLGHSMGDQVIKDTAIKLQVIFANCDLVSRFGGDEFCIFVKDIPAETLVDKLNFAIDKLADVYSNNGIRIQLTGSIGATYCSNPNVDYEQLFACADKALYEAKKNGRNQFVLTYI